MRQVLLIIATACIFAGCSKETSWGDPTNVEPYIGVFSNSDYKIYDDLLYGRLHVYDIGAQDTVWYGIPLIMNNKAFTYRVEYAQTMIYHYLNGSDVYIHKDDENIKWIEIANGSEPQGVSKGNSIDYKKVLPPLTRGGYTVRMTTECDGDTEVTTEVFCIND